MAHGLRSPRLGAVLSVDIYRDRPQPRLADRYNAIRKPLRRREQPQAYAAQSEPLACRSTPKVSVASRRAPVVIPAGHQAPSVERSLPRGHVEAAPRTARAIGLDRLRGHRNSREADRWRDLIMATIVSRILAPAS